MSNFFRTGTAVAYGRALSRRLGGAHFVIDTSRNGNGPSLQDDAGGPKWCNPPGRAIGRSPTTSTGQPKVDAYLWVKQPGASDGSCRAGAPPAGHWWPEYALQLVRNRYGRSAGDRHARDVYQAKSRVAISAAISSVVESTRRRSR